MIRLVCFDLGGVLLRICRNWNESCDRAGLERRGDLDALAAPTRDVWEPLNERYQVGALDVEAFSEGFSRSIDRLYDPGEVRRMVEACVLEEYEGVDRFVARVHEAGLLTCALSNTCHEHWLDMPRFPTVQALGERFASHEIAKRKPDAPAYRHVEAAMGCRGAEILFFDDTPENVEAALALGWRAHRIDHAGAPDAQMEAILARERASP